MKTCKKIVLIAMMFILVTISNVYGAVYVVDSPTQTAEVTLTQSSTTAKVGETVTITISAKYGNGIEGLDSILEYDKTKLQYIGLEAKNHFTSYSDIDGETGEFIFSVLYGEMGAPEEAPNEANLAVVSFKVLDTATVGETLTIKLSEIEVIDPDINSTTVEDQQVTLTIVGNQEPEGGDSEDGDPKDGNPESGEPEGGNPESGEPEGEDPEDGNPESGDPEGEDPEDGNPESGDPEGEDPESGDPEDGDPKDPTIADKPMNDAGLKTYGGIAILAILAIVLYKKYKKYRDIK